MGGSARSAFLPAGSADANLVPSIALPSRAEHQLSHPVLNALFHSGDLGLRPSLPERSRSPRTIADGQKRMEDYGR